MSYSFYSACIGLCLAIGFGVVFYLSLLSRRTYQMFLNNRNTASGIIEANLNLGSALLSNPKKNGLEITGDYKNRQVYFRYNIRSIPPAFFSRSCSGGDFGYTLTIQILSPREAIGRPKVSIPYCQPTKNTYLNPPLNTIIYADFGGIKEDFPKEYSQESLVEILDELRKACEITEMGLPYFR